MTKDSEIPEIERTYAESVRDFVFAVGLVVAVIWSFSSLAGWEHSMNAVEHSREVKVAAQETEPAKRCETASWRSNPKESATRTLVAN
jgi:hypothetical protein